MVDWLLSTRRSSAANSWREFFSPGLLNSADEDREALCAQALLLHRVRHASVVHAHCLVVDGPVIVGLAMELLGPSLQLVAQNRQLSGEEALKGPWCQSVRP